MKIDTSLLISLNVIAQYIIDPRTQKPLIGQVYFYKAGTKELKPIYRKTGTADKPYVVAENPVILDSAGRVPFDVLFYPHNEDDSSVKELYDVLATDLSGNPAFDKKSFPDPLLNQDKGDLSIIVNSEKSDYFIANSKFEFSYLNKIINQNETIFINTIFEREQPICMNWFVDNNGFSDTSKQISFFKDAKVDNTFNVLKIYSEINEGKNTETFMHLYQNVGNVSFLENKAVSFSLNLRNNLPNGKIPVIELKLIRNYNRNQPKEEITVKQITLENNNNFVNETFNFKIPFLLGHEVDESNYLRFAISYPVNQNFDIDVYGIAGINGELNEFADGINVDDQYGTKNSYAFGQLLNINSIKQNDNYGYFRFFDGSIDIQRKTGSLANVITGTLVPDSIEIKPDRYELPLNGQNAKKIPYKKLGELLTQNFNFPSTDKSSIFTKIVQVNSIGFFNFDKKINKSNLNSFFKSESNAVSFKLIGEHFPFNTIAQVNKKDPKILFIAPLEFNENSEEKQSFPPAELTPTQIENSKSYYSREKKLTFKFDPANISEEVKRQYRIRYVYYTMRPTTPVYFALHAKCDKLNYPNKNNLLSMNLPLTGNDNSFSSALDLMHNENYQKWDAIAFHAFQNDNKESLLLDTTTYIKKEDAPFLINDKNIPSAFSPSSTWKSSVIFLSDDPEKYIFLIKHGKASDIRGLNYGRSPPTSTKRKPLLTRQYGFPYVRDEIGFQTGEGIQWNQTIPFYSSTDLDASFKIGFFSNWFGWGKFPKNEKPQNKTYVIPESYRFGYDFYAGFRIKENYLPFTSEETEQTFSTDFGQDIRKTMFNSFKGVKTDVISGDYQTIEFGMDLEFQKQKISSPNQLFVVYRLTDKPEKNIYSFEKETFLNENDYKALCVVDINSNDNAVTIAKKTEETINNTNGAQIDLTFTNKLPKKSDFFYVTNNNVRMYFWFSVDGAGTQPKTSEDKYEIKLLSTDTVLQAVIKTQDVLKQYMSLSFVVPSFSDLGFRKRDGITTLMYL